MSDRGLNRIAPAAGGSGSGNLSITTDNVVSVDRQAAYVFASLGSGTAKNAAIGNTYIPADQFVQTGTTITFTDAPTINGQPITVTYIP